MLHHNLPTEEYFWFEHCVACFRGSVRIFGLLRYVIAAVTSVGERIRSSAIVKQ